MAPRWRQDGPRRPKIAPRWPQDGPKMGSGWAIKSWNTLWKIDILAVGGHLDPKMAQDGAKLAPRGPKIAQDGPKMGSRGRACACTCAFFGPDWDRGEVDRKASARAHAGSWACRSRFGAPRCRFLVDVTQNGRAYPKGRLRVTKGRPRVKQGGGPSKIEKTLLQQPHPTE